MLRRLIAGTTCAFVVGCGGGDDATTTRGLDAYERSALEISAAVADHREAAQTMRTAEDCRAALERYASDALPRLERIREMASRLDDEMRGLGRPEAADMACGAEVMRERLRQHVENACGSADQAANRERIAAHCDEMERLVQRERERVHELGAMTAGAGGMHHGDMSGMGEAGTGSAGGAWPSPERMPGCGYVDGEYRPENAGACADPAKCPEPATCTDGRCAGDMVQDRERDGACQDGGTCVAT